MMMAALVFIVIGVCGYVWLMRGFLSALLHLACTVAAGAIALGAWEPLGYVILDNAPDRGMFTFVRDAAWAISLALPFAAALALLRLATNKLVPFNATCGDAADAVGGLACGLGAGVLTAGFVMLTVGNLRVRPDALGFQPVSYTSQAQGRGSLERDRGLFSGVTPRADVLTAKFYEYLSLTTLRTSEPLGKWYPGLADAPAANRLTYDGKSRNTLKQKEFRVNGWYTVGVDPKADPQYRGGPLQSLLTDQWNPGANQAVVDLSGEPVRNGYVAGFQVQFLAGAKEKTGQVVVGAGQVRLIVESVTDDHWMALHPCAVVSGMDVSNLGPGEKPMSARFRYDGNDVFVSSVGGASETVMDFEFAVPSGYRPIGLYVKNSRWEVPGPPTQAFATPAQRDAAIVARGGVLPTPDTGAPATFSSFPPEGILASNAMGFVIQDGAHKSLDIERGDRGNNRVIDGEESFGIGEIRMGAGVDRNLRIDRFAVTPDTAVVRVLASGDARASLLSDTALSADLKQPIFLIDTNGQRYQPVGFIYRDNRKVHVRYTVGRPLQSGEELIQAGVLPSRSKPDATLELVFRPTFGARIASLQIGGTVIATWDPPLLLEFRQN